MLANPDKPPGPTPSAATAGFGVGRGTQGGEVPQWRQKGSCGGAGAMAAVESKAGTTGRRER